MPCASLPPYLGYVCLEWPTWGNQAPVRPPTRQSSGVGAFSVPLVQLAPRLTPAAP